MTNEWLNTTCRHTASPGFWWYISSHLYGTAASGSATPKTPVQSPMSMPVPVAAVPMPMPMPVSMPTSTAAAAAPATLATAVASSAVSSSSSSSCAGNARSPSTNVEPPAAVPGTGPAAAKTLNRFLRGSDLLTSLTTTFDRKWRSLVSQSSSQTQPLTESIARNKDDTSAEQQDQKSNAPPKLKYLSTEAYRDPSLHKSLDKNHLSRSKNDAHEKDIDSTVTDNALTHPSESITPNNDRSLNDKHEKTLTEKIRQSSDANEKDEDQKNTEEEEDRLRVENSKHYELASEKDVEENNKSDSNDVDTKLEDGSKSCHYEIGDTSYSNKLKRFESLTNSEARSRLKRSESLNKRTSECTTSRLKRSESLNKHSTERLPQLKRSESLNKHSSDRSESPGSKLKRSESLTKTEKTECNISKRRQSVRKDSATKLKRKNGMSERSIKRRHTVGGTKDFDKVHWLDNKLQSETERIIRNDYRPKKSQFRTSSPDLSTNRIGMADASFLIEVSFRGPSNVVFNVTNAARPQSLPDASLASKVFKVPLESHV